MDIKNLIANNLRSDGTSVVKPRTAATSETALPASNAAISESVTLTQAAKTMSSALDHASDVPFDAEKVARIKAAVSDGRYNIDNQRLADRMLRFERQLARPDAGVS